MIGPGWLPRPSRLAWRKRTLSYTRVRRRSPRKRALDAAPVHHEIVLFDRGPAEFPIATLRPREPSARAIALVADLSRWFAARWAWLRPRAVPVIVAAIGMVLVLLSADYLTHWHGQAPVQNDQLMFKVQLR